MSGPTASPPPAITGIVSGFTSRFEVDGRKQILVWDFNLIAEDAGHQRFEVPVEMRGTTFEGAIQNGDIISVDVPWRPGQIVHPTLVVNVRTRATIVAKGARQSASPWVRIASIVLFLIVITGLFVFFLSGVRFNILVIVGLIIVLGIAVFLLVRSTRANKSTP